ncbi:MAG: GumC family protein [Bacteroidales bacterium]
MLDKNQGGFTEPQMVEEEEINLVELLMKYLHYWKWFVASAVLFVALGALYLKTQNKVYQIDATVLLNDEKGKGRADMAALQELGILSGAGANVDNEIEVMRSKDLMLGVVNDLRLYTSIRESRGLRSINLYKQSPVDVAVSPELLDRLRKPLTFELKKEGKNEYVIKGEMGDEEFEKTFNSFPYELSLPFGTITLQTTTFDIDSEWSKLNVVVRNPMQVASKLAKDVSFQLAQKNGSVVRISMRNENIHEGEDILNKVVEYYNKETMMAKNETAMSTERFINERLSLLQTELASVEKDVEGYKKSNKLTNIEAESGLFITQTGEVDKERTEIATQLNVLNYIDEFVNKKENRYRIVPNIGITDAGLLKVIDEYNKQLLIRERTLRTTSEDNPTIITMNGDINSMRASILGGIDVVKRSLTITQQEIAKKESQISGRIKEVPRQERELMEIMRQQKIKDALYMFLLEKKEENSLSMTMTVPMARLIEKPYCNGLPVAPRGMVILMASFLLGLIVPVAVIFVRHLFNVTIDDRYDLETLTKLPILGEVSHENIEGRACIIKENSTSVSNELFRSVRNNLQFVTGMDHKKIITVTSNIPGEGKTFVSTNTAATFSLTGKRVILMGLDLRNPQLAKVFGLENKGVTNYLSGQVNDWKELVVRTPEYKNLDILPAGPVPLNPNELLMSSKMKELMDDLRNAYDYVIIDSAPVGVVSDTYLLNDLSDLFIFVCRANYTNRKLIDEVNRMVAQSKVKNAYFVVNDVDMKSKAYRYGKYGYGYGYGYGAYGYHGKEDKKKKKA